MVYLPLEELLPKAGYSSYKLMTLASRRALELADGAPKFVDAPANEKSATTALREIIAGKIMEKEASETIAAEKIAAAKAAKAAK